MTPAWAGQQHNCDPNAMPDGATTNTGELVQQLVNVADARQSVATLVKLVNNVMEHPNEQKFQEIRKANKLILNNVVNVAPCLTLLRRCGFCDQGEQLRLQASGLRLGELARLTVALAQYTLTQDLSVSLNGSMSRNLGTQVTAQGKPLQAGTVQFVTKKEVDQAGQPMKRPGWTFFRGYDADPYEDAYNMPAGNLEACLRCAEENGFGGICVWEGEAYFRETPGAQLRQRMQKAPGASFYIYEPPTGPPLADEEDPDLLMALRMSMQNE